MRPKAVGVEPHTHSKRRARNFLWLWQAEWLAGACAVRPSHFMRFLHEAILANAVRGIEYNASLSRGKLDVSFALAKETRLPVPNAY